MKHSIILVCAVLVLVSSAYIEKYQKTEDGSQYFIEFQGKYNWYEAVHACARKNMSLAAMDTQDKTEQFSKILKKISANTDLWLWLAGSSNAGYSRQYYWLTTGQSFAYANWAKGEPSIDDDENCVAIWSKEGNWNNVPCAMQIGYICEEIILVKPKNQDLLTTKEIQELKSKAEAEMKKSCEDEKTQIKKENSEKVSEMKKWHEKEMQELRDKCKEANTEIGSGGNGDTDIEINLKKQINQLKKDANELEIKLSECLKVQKVNGPNVTNKYYNLILNVTANAQQLKLMGNP